MNLTQVSECYSGTNIVVISTDPEMADYSNPNGNIYGHCAAVFVCAADGSQFQYRETRTRCTEREALRAVQSLVDRVNAAIKKGIKLNPNLWTEVRPSYGSEAYVKGNWSFQDAVEERYNETGCLF